MKHLNNAGGSPGGTGRFFIGLSMLCIGGYLLLSKISVHSGFGFGRGLYHFGGFQVTSGMIFIPFFIGVMMIFWNSKNIFGWLLSGLSVVALIAGVIVNTRITLQAMSAFDMLVLLILIAGGAGLFFSSLKSYS